jgi:hypothetical protein
MPSHKHVADAQYFAVVFLRTGAVTRSQTCGFSRPSERVTEAIRVRMANRDTRIGIGDVFRDCKVHPATGHEGPEGEKRYSCTLSLTSALDDGG